VVNAVLLRPLPYPDPEELVMVWQDHRRLDGPATEWASPDNFFDWRDQNEVFDGMFAFSDFGPTLTGEGEPEQLQGAVVSHDALEILGVEPLLGRSFPPEEDRAGAERVVLLSHSLWQRRFGADPAVLGRSITLDEKPATIVGVLAPEPVFPVLDSPELFAPLGIDPSNSCGRGCVTLA
jgi:putative ABC transport system permease protein